MQLLRPGLGLAHPSSGYEQREGQVSRTALERHLSGQQADGRDDACVSVRTVSAAAAPVAVGAVRCYCREQRCGAPCLTVCAVLGRVRLVSEWAWPIGHGLCRTACRSVCWSA